ncbi:MAG: prenyltransferase [Rhodoferax sp.]|jgi:1,4-dihydroxy-2-naphthoate octaprenyltransferase|uniref:prenyltransferase n=1 Tax=Rhodoferax sp. TaxID=50421 RepID=UPI001B440A3C|nr:prenyltransferase [Rhodoferax sp.]MBP9147455.1 prenyltransferase [Rhodoferax sp.]MBP9734445.1 prenyltransferase [Rhodoferax sp.]
MEQKNATQHPQEIALSTVWQLAQPASLTITVVASVLGIASAAGCGIAPDAAAALATVLLAVLFHAAANIWHACNAGSPMPAPCNDPWTPCASSGLITLGRISLTQARQTSAAVFGLVLLAGLWLALKAGGGLLLVALGGLALVWTYNAAPLQIGRRGWGSLSACLAWWLVVIGADYVQRRHFFLIPMVDALSFALLVANVALLRQARPIRWTFPVYALLALAAHGWLLGGVWLLYHPGRALWAMVSLPLSLVALYLLGIGASSPPRMALAFRFTLAAVFCHALAMSAALLSLTFI